MPMKVEKERHPLLWEVCTSVLQDAGGINRLEGDAPRVYELGGAKFGITSNTCNRALKALLPEDRQRFAIGEEADALDVLDEYPDQQPILLQLHDMLNKWHEVGLPRP